MRAVDTSAFIEWLANSPTGRPIEPLLPRRDAWIVPTMVQLELSKWLRREVDPERAGEVAAFMEKCVVVPLDTTIALLAAELSASAKLATADAVIYATARHHRASLLTSDAHFIGLPDVVHVPKLRA
ncbi:MULTISPECIES: type II toxin-antitoxin system VapC family toxin [unclassified Aureimonas]|uniref:type II toxin-antitoxin system VapC family toxin n=1 Tax=unclassified Aureimonas TaxID=2615206 RepID=UPI0006F3E2BF|nr:MULTISPECIES: type II toxin-antitoxin system VapC family toxin [unclassified Aureimonas]KQT65928.1 twitching motility protein PilT [Aureimonas sp. Leaf427]KQT73287.1 twitching motility protein PilT [Aureimonas sp. Leaf460]